MTAASARSVKSIFAEGKEAVKRKFWQAQPFPHIYFDDFLPAERFQQLTDSTRQGEEKPPDFTFATSLEKNKTTFANDSLTNESKALVDSITNKVFLDELSELTSIPEIIPLTAYKEHSFRFYHKMVDGGYLGSHVDHSAVNQDRVHFLNCIFYGPEKWDPAWGGETVLFDKWGFKPVAKVACRPNRLLIFLHTSQSFHGVSNLVGNKNPRLTFYMDYYAKVADLPRLTEQSRACGSSYKAKFWQHPTTFVPLTIKHSRRYLPGYIKYHLRQGF